jgi:hypothetical protein
MALSLDNIFISTIKLCIGLFKDAWPNLIFLLTLCESILVMLVNRQKIINYNKQLFGELEKSDHIGSFMIVPFLFIFIFVA